jgi:hypothetical protein
MANSIATAIAGRSTCMQMRWGKARVGGWVPRNVRLPIACLLSEQERGPQGTSPKQQEQQHGDLGPHVTPHPHVDVLLHTSNSLSFIDNLGNVDIEPRCSCPYSGLPPRVSVSHARPQRIPAALVGPQSVEDGSYDWLQFQDP